MQTPYPYDAHAREVAEQAIVTASRMQMPVAEVHAQLAHARVSLAQGGVDARSEIEATLDRALALVYSTGARSYEPQIYVERARLAGLRSDAAGREQSLREAHRLFTEMGARDTPNAWPRGEQSVRHEPRTTIRRLQARSR